MSVVKNLAVNVGTVASTLRHRRFSAADSAAERVVPNRRRFGQAFDIVIAAEEAAPCFLKRARDDA
jgi:hypothetical protein